MKEQNNYQISVELLNDALGKEIATTLQYLYFHVHFEDAGYDYLARLMQRVAIAEMKHIEEISERVLFLRGDVEMNASFQTRQIADVKGSLEFAMQLERSTIDSYNESSKMALDNGDAVTHKMFQNLSAQEEEHFDIFRTELQNMIDYGDHYLVLQSIEHSREKAEGKMAKEPVEG